MEMPTQGMMMQQPGPPGQQHCNCSDCARRAASSAGARRMSQAIPWGLGEEHLFMGTVFLSKLMYFHFEGDNTFIKHNFSLVDRLSQCILSS